MLSYLVIEYNKFAQFIFIYLFLYCNIKRQGFVLTDCVGSMIANRIWNVGMNITWTLPHSFTMLV